MKTYKIAAFAALLLSSPFLSVASDDLAKEEQKVQSIITMPININQASIEQLVLLKGVGKKKARAIINYREANGKFYSADDLSNVKGISDKTVEANRTIIAL
ncbi:helix-hairpin-helix domain-containing protein [Thalassotalea sp. M1531]|uniref:Helix-hairpin-helix domain-containing protein n=1 Tax=Thalassotalea algicola TaxID=2716224 RepID=A0A7Y0LE09_9GAMM|nr:helix-hairpin-helix domain-containing protein [Thalassotalea algicola]NMP31405.1 helix-hairpin-helix domain-containing protein [Thalassotalea algicola]